MSSSCCGGNCGCGSACKCGSSCGGCKMYPDTSSSERSSTSETLVLGVAPNKSGFETGRGGGLDHENSGGGCKCNPCTCQPCNCK